MDEIEEIKIKKIDIISPLYDNRTIIYPIMFYISGLIIGSLLYKILDNSVLKDLINLILGSNSRGLEQLFIDNLIYYICIYMICVILGLCIIGFQVVNLIPLFYGYFISTIMSYYYTNFNTKGIGYCLLLIVPSTIFFMTTLAYTIELSNILSKYIFNLSIKKSGMIKEFNLKSYLIRFIIFGIITVIISFISALLNYLLSSIISL